MCVCVCVYVCILFCYVLFAHVWTSRPSPATDKCLLALYRRCGLLEKTKRSTLSQYETWARAVSPESSPQQTRIVICGVRLRQRRGYGATWRSLSTVGLPTSFIKLRPSRRTNLISVGQVLRVGPATPPEAATLIGWLLVPMTLCSTWHQLEELLLGSIPYLRLSISAITLRQFLDLSWLDDAGKNGGHD